MFAFLLAQAALAEPLSLQQSIDLVRTQSPEVQIARLQAEQAALDPLKTLTHVLNVKASGSWLNFGEPLDTFIMGDGSTEVDCSSFEAFGFGDLCQSFSEPLRVRDERIFDGSIQVALPISALYSIVEGYAAQRHLQEIKSLEIQQTAQRIELSVIEIYLQVLELQAQKGVLQDTLKRLQQHQKSVNAFVEQGFVHPVQSKELALAIQQTELGIRQIEQGYTLLCKQMRLVLGLESAFEPMPLQNDILPLQEGRIDSLSRQIAEHQYLAAQNGLHAAVGDLIPTVALMAATTSTKGQGPFTPTSQQYMGLSIQGEFGWGQKWMTVKQRQFDVSMAEKGLALQTEAQTLQQEQLRQDWEQRAEEIQIAESRVEIEAIKRTQMQAKFNAHQTTITDVLDQEADFADANIALLRSRHQQILAQAKYQQSLNATTLSFKNAR